MKLSKILHAGLGLRHRKRGTTYEVVGLATLQTDAPLTDEAKVAVYRCDRTGKLWVRPVEEFTEERFLALPPNEARNLE